MQIARLYAMSDDRGVRDLLSFLLARDTMHQNQWLAAIEELERDGIPGRLRSREGGQEGGRFRRRSGLLHGGRPGEGDGGERGGEETQCDGGPKPVGYGTHGHGSTSEKEGSAQASV